MSLEIWFFHETIFPFGKGDSTNLLSNCFGSINDSTVSNLSDYVINIPVVVSNSQPLSESVPTVLNDHIKSSIDIPIVSAPNIDVDYKEPLKILHIYKITIVI